MAGGSRPQLARLWLCLALLAVADRAAAVHRRVPEGRAYELLRRLGAERTAAAGKTFNMPADLTAMAFTSQADKPASQQQQQQQQPRTQQAPGAQGLRPAAGADKQAPTKQPKGGNQDVPAGPTGLSGGSGGSAGGFGEPPPPITTIGGIAKSNGGNGNGGNGNGRNGSSSASGGMGAGDGSGSSWPAAIKQLGNPSCLWIEEEKMCIPTLDNWLIPQGVPSSPWRRANLLAVARQRHCSNITKADACWAQQELRCFWHQFKDGDAECRSADIMELFFYVDSGFGGTVYDIPTAMTCPGSKAFDFFKCFGHPAAAENCEKLKDCFAVDLETGANNSSSANSGPPQPPGGAGRGPRSICLPNMFADMSSKELDEFLALLMALDGRLFGNCAASCWMKQARACRQLKATTRKECEVVPFCQFDRSRGRCLKRSLEFDGEFDYKVRRLYGLCLDIDNAEDCKVTQLTKPKPSVDWKAYKDQTEPVKCVLP